MVLRSSTVATVESILEWRKFVKGGAKKEPSKSRPGSSNSRPEVESEFASTGGNAGGQASDETEDTAALPPFVWEGRNYLRKMRTDTDFLADVPQLVRLG